MTLNTIIDEKIRENNYFEYRNVDCSKMKNNKIPIWIKSELLNSDLNILDYGCGYGQTLQALDREGYKNCYGVDIENTAIKACQDNNLRVMNLDLDNLINPYDLKFEVIILSHIIEHIPKSNIISTLSVIKKEFLADEGKLLIAVPNAQSNTGVYWAYEDWTHTTLFTSGSLYYVLRAAGFENIDFIDIDCVYGKSFIGRVIRHVFLKLYRMNLKFWNKITCSYYHEQSPKIFSYEIKCKAY